MAKARSVRERFDEKCFVEPNTGCWLWTANCVRGYGRIKVEGRSRQAHRISWELNVGAIPEGMNVLHRCDTPPCVNPGHLFLGTAMDNIHDMIGKGRARIRGEQSGRAKLTKAQVAEIRTRLKAGETQVSVAADLGVVPQTITHIHLGSTWEAVA